MKYYIQICMLSALLSGCYSDNKSRSSIEPVKSVSDVIKVYKSDGSLQCASGGVSLEDMRKQLVEKGIDVICSQEGNTGMMYAAVCGGGTGKINIYKIHSQNLQDAENIGFRSVKELAQYTDMACQQ